MRRESPWILGVGLGLSFVWTLIFLNMGWDKATRFLVGGGVLFVLLASTLVVFLASVDRLDLVFRDPNQPQPPRRPYHPQQDEEEYLRRRAEDARMRDLMNPNSKQAPPTDWFGR